MIDLSPETETILAQEAAREGMSVDALIRRTFAPHAPQPDSKALRLMEAIRAWQTEDATDDEEVLLERDQARIILQANLDQNRQKAGMRLLFSGQD